MLASRQVEIHTERDRKLERPDSNARVTQQACVEEQPTRRRNVGQPLNGEFPGADLAKRPAHPGCGAYDE